MSTNDPMSAVNNAMSGGNPAALPQQAFKAAEDVFQNTTGIIQNYWTTERQNNEKLAANLESAQPQGNFKYAGSATYNMMEAWATGRVKLPDGVSMELVRMIYNNAKGYSDHKSGALYAGVNEQTVGGFAQGGVDLLTGVAKFGLPMLAISLVPGLNIVGWGIAAAGGAFGVLTGGIQDLVRGGSNAVNSVIRHNQLHGMVDELVNEQNQGAWTQVGIAGSLQLALNDPKFSGEMLQLEAALMPSIIQDASKDTRLPPEEKAKVMHDGLQKMAQAALAKLQNGPSILEAYKELGVQNSVEGVKKWFKANGYSYEDLSKDDLYAILAYSKVAQLTEGGMNFKGFDWAATMTPFFEAGRNGSINYSGMISYLTEEQKVRNPLGAKFGAIGANLQAALGRAIGFDDSPTTPVATPAVRVGDLNLTHNVPGNRQGTS